MKPLDRTQSIQRHRLNLPHWRQEGVTYFVTFRLADSLPAEKLRSLRDEKRTWLTAHGVTVAAASRKLPEAAQREYYRRFEWQVDQWLDAGFGSCRLRGDDAREIVVDALEHFDGERYRVDAWVVMPNHVHALVEPCGSWSLGDIVGSWKKFSARMVNQLDGRTGPFWQEEGYDHIVRSREQHARLVKYIAENPVKARLRGGYTVGGSALQSRAGQSGGQK